jgi:hypothetical protein
MTPISETERAALRKEAEPVEHLPFAKVRRSDLARLLAYVEELEAEKAGGFDLSDHLNVASRRNPLASAFAVNAKRGML